MWQDLLSRINGSLTGFFAVMLAFMVARYFLLSGLFYLIFWRLTPSFMRTRRIQSGARPTVIGHEILWSQSTMLWQAGFATLLYWFYLRGDLKIYLDVAERGWGYWGFTLAVLFVWHDFYFYWSHRFLHLKGLYHRFHLTHHRSMNPTPFATLSVHPVEAVIEVAFVAPVVALMPVHPGALTVFFLLTYIFNITGHLGYEMAPRGTWDKWWGRWLTTNTHHNVHHQSPNGNYGLYLRYWDLWFGTLHDKTGERFRQVTEPSYAGAK